MKETVAVDFDGVLAQYDGWKGVRHLGDPIPGAVEFVQRLMEKYIVLIHTTRLSSDLHDDADLAVLVELIRKWLDKHGFPDGVELWIGQGKPIAVAYVDDRAIVCNPREIGASAFRIAEDCIRRVDNG